MLAALLWNSHLQHCAVSAGKAWQELYLSDIPAGLWRWSSGLSPGIGGYYYSNARASLQLCPRVKGKHDAQHPQPWESLDLTRVVLCY